MQALHAIEESKFEVFAASDMLFSEMKKSLENEDAATMTHTELEGRLKESGTNLLRQYCKTI